MIMGIKYSKSLSIRAVRNKRKQGKKGEGKEEAGDGREGGKERPHPRFIIERRLSLVEQTRSLSLKTESGGNPYFQM